MDQVQELQQLLQIYIRRLNEETSKSIAFEARIVQLINQINSMQPQGKDAGDFATPPPKKNVGKVRQRSNGLVFQWNLERHELSIS